MGYVISHLNNPPPNISVVKDKDNASTPYFTPAFLKYLAKTLDQWQVLGFPSGLSSSPILPVVN